MHNLRNVTTGGDTLMYGFQGDATSVRGTVQSIMRHFVALDILQLQSGAEQANKIPQPPQGTKEHSGVCSLFYVLKDHKLKAQAARLKES